MGQVLDPLLVALVNGRQYAALQTTRRTVGNTAYGWGTPLWSDKIPGNTGNLLFNNDGVLDASNLITHSPRGTILSVKAGCATDTLQQWKDSLGNLLASVASNGSFKTTAIGSRLSPAIGLPSLSSVTGFFVPATDQFGITVNGTATCTAGGTTWNWNSALNMNWSSGSPDAAGPDTGMSRASAKVIRIQGSNGTVSGTLSSPSLSSTTLSSDQNDYNPGVARRYRLSTDGLGARNVTGLSISQVDDISAAVGVQIITDHGAGSYVRNTEPANSSIATILTDVVALTTAVGSASVTLVSPTNPLNGVVTIYRGSNYRGATAINLAIGLGVQNLTGCGVQLRWKGVTLVGSVSAAGTTNQAAIFEADADTTSSWSSHYGPFYLWVIPVDATARRLDVKGVVSVQDTLEATL